MATDTRKGLNAYFCYQSLSGKQVFYFRCWSVQWGFQSVYDEDEAREHRAMYPHRVATSQFIVVPMLVGYQEKKTFNDWMTEYAKFAITPDPRTNIKMTVVCAARNFMQVGVYKSGIAYGDTVAHIVWQPSIVFEAAYDPLDKNSAVSVSSFTFNNSKIFNKASAYFYPASDADTLSGRKYGDDFQAVVEPTSTTTTAPPEDDGTDDSDPFAGVTTTGSAPITDDGTTDPPVLVDPSGGIH